MKIPLALAMLLGLTVLSTAQDLDRDNFDTSVRIQDDLYRHVNGSWLKSVEIPSDKSNYGSFTALDDLSQERIHAILEEYDHHLGFEQIKSYYTQPICVDSHLKYDFICTLCIKTFVIFIEDFQVNNSTIDHL